MKIIHFESIDSTNTYIKENYPSLNDFDIVSASHQTDGKGRFGNVWIDDHQSALFSVLIKRDLDINTLSQIPLIAATACHKVLVKYLSNLSIKWPNDLYVDDKKIAGILTESVILNKKIDALIIGIGINVSNLDFHESIKDYSTSILKSSNKEISIPLLIQEISKVLYQEFILFEQNKSDFLNYCRDHAYLIGKHITYIFQDKEISGLVIDINQIGNLLVKTEKGIQELSSGEVKLKK